MHILFELCFVGQREVYTDENRESLVEAHTNLCRPIILTLMQQHINRNYLKT